MAYQSKYTGVEVDALLDKVNSGEVGGKVAVDSSLSTESENPVQNKVITEELGKKATTSALSTLETKVDTNKESTDNALLGLSTKANNNEADIQSLEKIKANTTGYYPQLHVGLSDNLPDRGDVTEGLIGFRESAGADNSIEDGTANVQELLGESLVWNQLQNNVGDILIDGTNKNIVGSKLEFTAIESKGGGHMYQRNLRVKVIAKHKYIILSDCVNSRGLTPRIKVQASSYAGNIGDVFTNSSNGEIILFPFGTSETINIGDVATLSYLSVYDLTQMFGAGKEPSTIEEFNALKNQLVGVDFNAYNAGEVLGVNIKGIKSVNDNAWDEEWESGQISASNGQNGLIDQTIAIRSKNYIKVLPNQQYAIISPVNTLVLGYDAQLNYTGHLRYGGVSQNFHTQSTTAYIKFCTFNANYGTTYNHDICIRLAHSGYKTDYVPHEESKSSFDLTPYFPNGMHGIGAVRDSATPKKATKRIGEVDMGTLNWQKGNSGAGGAFSASLNNASNTTTRNVITIGKYEPHGSAYTNSDPTRDAICISGKRVYVTDTQISDVATFKAAMSGVMLYYELVTPIETEIDPQLNMNYKVWDFGTEELLTDSKSAPVLARTIYGFNATDTIRGNKAKNEEQDVRLHTLESEVVRIGDYQPDLSVGVADQLAGQDEPTASEINFRRSGGGAILDGNARIEAIKGNSVVWNQHIDTSGFTTLVSNGVHFERQADGGIKVYTDEGGATANTNCGYFPSKHGFLGHYCAILGCPQGGGWDSYYINDGSEGFADLGGGRIKQKTQNNIAVTIAVKQGAIISTPVVFYPQFIDLTKMFQAGNEPTTIEEFYARIPMGVDENAYNEGEVIHMDVQSVESQGVNAWDEEWELGRFSTTSGAPQQDVYTQIMATNLIKVIPNATYSVTIPVGGIWAIFYDYQGNVIKTPPHSGPTSGNSILIREVSTFVVPSNASTMKFYCEANYGTTYNHDICINLSDASINGKYFPYVKRMQSLDIIRKYFPQGMKSAGAAHDEIRYNKATQKWEYSERKIKSVDMGSMQWYISNGRFVCDFPNAPAVTDGLIRGLCVKYVCVSPSEVYNNLDKAMFVGASGWFNPDASLVIVNDTAYTDAATFKASLQGVMLYYESNDWEWVELDKEDQLRNFDYQVWNCGTEQAIANVPSTPLKADIVYGFNAYGTIKQLKEQMAVLMTQMAQMQTAMASVTSNEE